MRVCSPLELDSVAGVTVGGGEECLERCEGPIVDVERLPSTKNEEGLAGLLALYENIKYPHHKNIRYPTAMKGENHTEVTPTNDRVSFLVLEFKNRLKFVKISFSSSIFDSITKVRKREMS